MRNAFLALVAVVVVFASASVLVARVINRRPATDYQGHPSQAMSANVASESSMSSAKPVPDRLPRATQRTNEIIKNDPDPSH